MNAIRRWLGRPAFTRGAIVFVVAAVAVANGIQALTGISDGWTLLVVAGLVIAGHIAWDLWRAFSKRKASRQ